MKVLTVENVLQDTQERFERGDDSRENLKSVLALIRKKSPQLLEEPVKDAVWTDDAKL